MKSQRRFGSVLIALLFVAMTVGSIFAQDQEGAPPPPPPDNGSVQQGEAPPPPDVSVPQGDQGAAAPQQQYPQQQYPQQQYPQQPNAGGVQTQDPSGRVARVQYMSGEVSIQPGGVNDWIAASQNRPLTTADRIWTDKNSRAELNVGDGFIRMNSETSLTLTNVSDGTVQLELDQGILSLTVRHLERGEIYEVDTPNYAFTVMKPGVYRFDVYPNEDQSWVTARSGYGEATGRGSAVRVNSGQQVRFSNGNSLQHTAENAPARDGFDDWAQVRDKRLESSLSARYVSPGVIGYQDLDQYGHWVPTPAYGNVWVPYSVPSGWAPYRFGHWVWIAPWGWTWVDDAPWGFAPFHYGRWVSWGGAWAWAPGPLGYWNPYYAPALVGWIGGPGFGIGFGFGGGFGIGIGFGWFPLGWGQPFFPHYCGWGHGGWYRGGGYVSNAYFRNVNITNTHITKITNVSRNYYSNNVAAMRNVNPIMKNGVTSASRAAFTSGAAVNRVGGAVPASALGNAHLLNTASVSPTRSSVLGGQAARTSGVPSTSAMNRPVVTRVPPPTRPASFSAAQAATNRGNLNAFNRGNVAGTGKPATQPSSSALTRGGVNGSPASKGVPQTRGPVTGGTDARLNTPTSMGGSYVPRPPSAGGRPTSAMNLGAATSPRTTSTMGGHGAVSAPSQSVPRPPAANDTFARHNAGTANYGNNRAAVTGPTGNNKQYGTGTSTMPRPPQSYTPNHAGSATSQYPKQYSTPKASSPAQSAPRGGSGNSSHGNNSSHGSGAALSVPRPPAGYSYHSAPAYSASSNSASRPMSSYGAGGSSRYPSASGYGSARNSYGSMPSYSPGRGYASSRAYSARSNGSTPTYSARSYSSAPSYGGRSMSSYSAPRSGGGGSYRASAGGGGYHGGGGGHSSGGGGGHSSGGHGR